MKKRKEGRERLERVVARFFKRSGRTRHEVIVCHANLIRSLVLRVTSGSPLGFHQFRMHHGGITSFVVSERGVNVIGFNVLEHLPFDMRSER